MTEPKIPKGRYMEADPKRGHRPTPDEEAKIVAARQKAADAAAAKAAKPRAKAPVGPAPRPD